MDRSLLGVRTSRLSATSPKSLGFQGRNWSEDSKTMSWVLPWDLLILLSLPLKAKCTPGGSAPMESSGIMTTKAIQNQSWSNSSQRIIYASHKLLLEIVIRPHWRMMVMSGLGGGEAVNKVFSWIYFSNASGHLGMEIPKPDSPQHQLRSSENFLQLKE